MYKSMSEKNTSALQNTSALSSDSSQTDQNEVVEFEIYRKEKDVKAFNEAAQDHLQPPSEQEGLPEAENAKDTSLTIDDHLSHALVNLEMELDIAQQVKRDLEATKDRMNQLHEQLQKARREAEAARSELDTLHLEEARARAELEVTQTERLRIEAEVRQTQPLIEQLQQQAKQAKFELHEANEKLESAKAIRDKERAENEKAKHALYATVALETQILAEIESARLSEERDRRQTEEIEARLKALQEQLDESRSTAGQVRNQLQNARISEAKMRVEVAPALSNIKGVDAVPEAGQTVGAKISSDSSLDSDVPAEPSRLIKNPGLPENLVELPPTRSFPSANSEPSPSETEEQAREPDDSPEEPEVHSANANRLSDPSHHKSDSTENASSIAETVYNLADAGYQLDEISRATHIAQGQVELLLKMRSLKVRGS